MFVLKPEINTREKIKERLFSLGLGQIVKNSTGRLCVLMKVFSQSEKPRLQRGLSVAELRILIPDLYSLKHFIFLLNYERITIEDIDGRLILNPNWEFINEFFDKIGDE